MKILLTAALILAMPIMAMALECPDESLKMLYNEDQIHFGLSYQCDDNSLTTVLVTDQAVTIDKLVEYLTTMDCKRVPQTGEIRMLICR